MKRFWAWLCSPLLVFDGPIIRERGDTRRGPTGNWYIEHRDSPCQTTTHLSGHLTRAGAEYEVALCKKHLPWARTGEWVIKPTSEYRTD